jgi:hypothetical protein
MAESDGAGRSSGVFILDRYLATSFQSAAQFGVYQVLVRRRAGSLRAR